MNEKLSQNEQVSRPDLITLTPEQQMAVMWLHEEPDNQEMKTVLKKAMDEVMVATETTKEDAGRMNTRVTCQKAKMFFEAQQWSDAWENADSALYQATQEGDDELMSEAQRILDELDTLPPGA